LRSLVEAGADLEETLANAEGFGERPLVVAARRGHVGAVKALIGLGARIEAADCDGYTALCSAAEEGEVKTVKALIAAGANIHVLLRDGSCALDRVGYDNREIRALLKLPSERPTYPEGA
jgi:ankyrin repeat protein